MKGRLTKRETLNSDAVLMNPFFDVKRDELSEKVAFLFEYAICENWSNTHGCKSFFAWDE